MFHPDMHKMVHILNEFALKKHWIVTRFEDIDDQYNLEDTHRYNRLEWLSAKREAMRLLDQACRDGAVMEQAIWVEYIACQAPAKDFFDEHVKKMGEFPQLRIKYRYLWYYTATAHRWRWEPQGEYKPLTYRLFESGCKSLGCSSEQGCRFLAWVDLLATELLPRHTSLFLTIPFRLMS